MEAGHLVALMGRAERGWKFVYFSYVFVSSCKCETGALGGSASLELNSLKLELQIVVNYPT